MASVTMERRPVEREQAGLWSWWVWAGAAAVALVLHLVFLRSLWGHDPLARIPILDSAYYLEIARRWLAGEIVPPDYGLLLLPPGYPLFLAPVLPMVGERLWIVVVVQAVLAAAGLAVLGRLAERLVGRPGAVAAVVLLTLYGPHQLMVSSLVSESLVLPVVAGFLYLSVLRRWPAAQVLLLGFAYLLRPNLLPFLGLLLAWLAWRDRRWLLRMAWVLVFLVPIPALHWATTGTLVLTSAQAGAAMYLGNHPGAAGLFTNRLGIRGDMHELADQVVELTRRRAGAELTPAEVNRYWVRQVVGWAREDPAAFVGNLALKGLRLVDSHEYATDRQWLADVPPAARLFPVPFALVVGLAAAGLVGIRDPRWAVPLLYLAGVVAGLLLYYPSMRHRYLLLPVLVLLAARGVEMLRRRRPAAAVVGLVVLAVSAVGVRDHRRTEEPSDHFNRARLFLAEGDVASARRFVERALAVDWNVPFYHRLRARVAAAEGRSAEARRSEIAAFLLGDDDQELINRVARDALARGNLRFAEVVFRRAAERYPHAAAPRMNLAQVLAADGRLGEARSAYADALARGSRPRPELERAIGWPGDD